MSHVFISYARASATQARRIADTLRSLGYTVWNDEDLPAHRPYAEVIDERLRSAGAVVVLWSADATKSQWVRAEADVARRAGVLVQVRLDGAVPPLPFDQIECADLTNWSGDTNARGWRKVVNSIADLVGDGGAAPLQIAPPRSSPPTPRRSSRRAQLGVGVACSALLIAGAVAWWLASQERPPNLGNGRVEAMRLSPQGDGAEVRKVADDFTASLVVLLAGAGVQVAQGANRAVGQTAAPELRVAGSVGRDGTGYALNVQVIDTKSELVLWTLRQSKTEQDQANSPGEIPEVVAGVIHCALEDRKAARPPLSTEALSLYMNACSAVLRQDTDGGRMLPLTRKLVKVAPRFAGAHAMHAISAARAAQIEGQSLDMTVALHAEAKSAAETALRLDPNTPKAFIALAANEGAFADHFGQNSLAIDRYLGKALALDPDSPPARVGYVALYSATGRLNEALALIREMNGAGDPRSGPGDARVAFLLAAKGHLADAYTALDRLEASTRISQASARWQIMFWWEDPKIALSRVRSTAPVGTPEPLIRCYEQFLGTLMERHRKNLRGLPPSCVAAAPISRVRMLAREGDLDGAFGALQPPLPGGMAALYYPEMRDLRHDPRFWGLAKRLGLVDYWRQTNRWPDFCVESGQPNDCRAAANAA